MKNDKAVIDRIEDGKYAVLLVGKEEKEKIIPIEALPAGTREGSWVIMHMDGTISPDPDTTDAIRSRIQDKLARLQKRGRRK
jgi:hypothetical protein